jgi:hypothetical protein
MKSYRYVFESSIGTDNYEFGTKMLSHISMYYHAAKTMKVLLFEVIFTSEPNVNPAFINHTNYGERTIKREEAMGEKYQEQIKLYVEKYMASLQCLMRIY